MRRRKGAFFVRVLDIDLDFFLADTCPLAPKGERPELAGHEPWPEQAVRDFLREHLRLTPERPVPGRVFETHDGALFFWQELIGSGRLTPPFEVTHIDAHSDLGIGKPGPGIVLGGALCQRMVNRCDARLYAERGQLDEANYLLYALAFRWVRRLENVRNPKSKPDMPPQIVARRDVSGAATALRLVPPLPELFEGMNGAEPEIAYQEYGYGEEFFADGPYDFASLAISPRYAPREADALAEVIAACFAPC